MRSQLALRCAACATYLAASGCTTLREIPRAEYAALPERRDVRLETTTGLVYEFDFARFVADSVTGYRRHDVEGALEEFGSQQFPLDDVSRLASRGIDWTRTGLIAGGALALVVAAGLKATTRADGGEDPTSGPGGPRVP